MISSSDHALRVAREHGAELGHAASLEPAGLDRVDQLAVVARLLPVVGEDPRAQKLVDGDLGLARTVRAHQAYVLARLEGVLWKEHLVPGGHRYEQGRLRVPCRARPTL